MISVNIAYFNQNFKKGWRNFLDAERLDLLTSGMNNVTNAFKWTGLYPYDPNGESWAGAIETLGLGYNNIKGKVQYEVYPLTAPIELSLEEKNALCNGTNVDAQNNITSIIGVAHMVAEQILAKWHQDIDEAVREGETYEGYANILVPQAKADTEKITLKLIELCTVDFDELPKNA